MALNLVVAFVAQTVSTTDLVQQGNWQWTLTCTDAGTTIAPAVQVTPVGAAVTFSNVVSGTYIAACLPLDNTGVAITGLSQYEAGLTSPPFVVPASANVTIPQSITLSIAS